VQLKMTKMVRGQCYDFAPKNYSNRLRFMIQITATKRGFDSITATIKYFDQNYSNNLRLWLKLKQQTLTKITASIWDFDSNYSTDFD
jgi:hypothetical protein